MRPAADIRTGLADRFRLLTGGPRTTDTRQQSLHASITWSYRLLDDDERQVLRRLAVFRSPFTADAARAVATGDGIDEHDVLPLLANLVAKSFVVIDERAATPRYRLLETIRDYAAEELEAHRRDAVATKDRHLRHLRDTAESIEPAFEGPGLLGWLGQFESELPDIKAAVGWAAATGDADEALRLMGALWRFWFFRARGDGRRIVEAALAIDGGDDRWRTKALIAATMAAMARFEPDMIGFGEEAVRVGATCGDPALSARAHCWLGWACAILDPRRAEPLLSRACELAREAGDTWCLADALNAMSMVTAPDPPASRAHAEEALELATHNGNQITACHARAQLAAVSVIQGRLKAAGAIATEALHTAERIGDSTFATVLRFILAWRAALQEDNEAAAANGRAAMAIATASGNPVDRGFALFAGGVHCYVGGELDEARTALAEALPTMAVFAGGLFAPYMAEMLADVALNAGDLAAAREFGVRAAEYADQTRNNWGRSRASLVQCRLDLHDGEVLAAAETGDRALTLARDNEDALTTVDALELVAQVALIRRKHETASRLLGAAAAERRRVGYTRGHFRDFEHASSTAQLKQGLGPDEFDEAWAQGERLTLDDALTLARSRRGSRDRPAAGWDALTPAELRVVGLIGEGLNNIEIAERLFVTRDTIQRPRRPRLRQTRRHQPSRARCPRHAQRDTRDSAEAMIGATHPADGVAAPAADREHGAISSPARLVPRRVP